MLNSGWYMPVWMLSITQEIHFQFDIYLLFQTQVFFFYFLSLFFFFGCQYVAALLMRTHFIWDPWHTHSTAFATRQIARGMGYTYVLNWAKFNSRFIYGNQNANGILEANASNEWHMEF